jgi:hypothetical protein
MQHEVAQTCSKPLRLFLVVTRPNAAEVLFSPAGEGWMSPPLQTSNQKALGLAVVVTLC